MRTFVLFVILIGIISVSALPMDEQARKQDKERVKGAIKQNLGEASKATQRAEIDFICNHKSPHHAEVYFTNLRAEEMEKERAETMKRLHGISDEEMEEKKSCKILR